MWIDNQIFLNADKDIALEIFVPQDNMVVCGRTNNEELEVQLDSCRKDNIPVLKRAGGGGTVLLHPGCVVVSLGCWVRREFQNPYYFEKINDALINCFELDLRQDGISDICFGEKKIAGTSMFRSKNYLLYQASLLCEDRLDLISKYLKHPSSEPEYRRNRSHSDFISHLSHFDKNLSSKNVCTLLNKNFKNHLLSQLEGDLISSQGKFVDRIKNKASSDSSI